MDKLTNSQLSLIQEADLYETFEYGISGDASDIQEICDDQLMMIDEGCPNTPF